MEYLIILFVMVVLSVSFFDITTMNFQIKGMVYGCLFMFMLLICLFRPSDFGYDYGAYVDIFYASPSFDDLIVDNKNLDYRVEFVEKGFLLFLSIIKVFTTDSIYMFFITAFLSLGLYFSSIRKYTSLWYMGVLVYIAIAFFHKEVGQIRHGLAMAIMFYSLRYVVSEHYKKFICAYIISCFIHVSLLPSIIVLLYKKVYLSKNKIIFFISFCCILYFTSNIQFFMYILELLGIFDDRLFLVVSNPLLNAEMPIERIVLTTVLAFGAAIRYKAISKNNEYFNLGMMMTLIGLFFLCYFHELKEFGQRLSAFFLLGQIIVIPELFYRNRYFILGWFFMLIIFSIYVYNVLNNEAFCGDSLRSFLYFFVY